MLSIELFFSELFLSYRRRAMHIYKWKFKESALDSLASPFKDIPIVSLHVPLYWKVRIVSNRYVICKYQMFLTRNILDYICNKHIYCMRGINYKCETQKLKSNNFSDCCGFLAPLLNFLGGVVVNALASYFLGRRFKPHAVEPIFLLIL